MLYDYKLLKTITITKFFQQAISDVKAEVSISILLYSKIKNVTFFNY